MSDTPTDSTPGTTPEAPPPATETQVRERPAPPRLDRLPPFRVLLHNDDVNDMLSVVRALVDLTPMDVRRARDVMLEAHRTGVALVTVTHRERAELYAEQFRSRRLTVTYEPAE